MKQIKMDSENPISDLVYAIMNEVSDGQPILRWGDLGTRWCLENVPNTIPPRAVSNPETIASQYVFSNGVLAVFRANVSQDNPKYGWENAKVWEKEVGEEVYVRSRLAHLFKGDMGSGGTEHTIVYQDCEFRIGVQELDFSRLGLALWLSYLGKKTNLLTHLACRRGDYDKEGIMPVGPLSVGPEGRMEVPRSRGKRPSVYKSMRPFFIVPNSDFNGLFLERERQLMASGKLGSLSEKISSSHRGEKELEVNLWYSVEISSTHYSMQIPHQVVPGGRLSYVPIGLEEFKSISLGESQPSDFAIAEQLAFDLSAIAPPDLKTVYKQPAPRLMSKSEIPQKTRTAKSRIEPSYRLAQAVSAFAPSIVSLESRLGPLMNSFLNRARREEAALNPTKMRAQP